MCLKHSYNFTKMYHVYIYNNNNKHFFNLQVANSLVD